MSALAVPSMPDLDLDIPPRVSAPADTAAGPSVRSQLEESLSRPTLLGDVGTLAGEASRLASNTDQATVPLIDFDLTGADVPLNTSPGRGGALTGSPMAAQIATKLDLARADCTAIGQRFGADEGQACEAILRTRTGRAAEAVPLRERRVALADNQGPLAQDWLRYHLGDALRTAGDPARAVAVWQAHLQARPRAHLVRLSLAELLNAQGRAADALRVSLVDAVPGDGLLVQALLASQALGDGQTARLASLVAQRLQSQALRDEALIERPQMVYLIRHRRGDAQDLARGLSLATENWRTQQEPPDAALLVEAALASNQPAAAAPVLDWLQATGYTDPTLAPLAQTLRTRLGR